MRQILILFVCLAASLSASAATGLRGIVVDSQTSQPVADANVLLSDQAILVVTDATGSFTISNAQVGSDVLQIIANGYSDQYMDVEIVAGTVRDLGQIKITPTGYDDESFNANTDYIFDEMDLMDDDSSNQSVATIQGANDNVYYQNASWNFQPMYFRMRGYNSEMQKGYINGMEFNDVRSGRFNWSGLGGMTSTAFRNKTVGIGTEAVSFGFGGLGGATNYTTYASEYAPGFRGMATYQNSDYMLRAGLQYNSGLNKNGWAWSATLMGRYAPEGVVEGTFYNSLAYALSVQKVFNDKHSINITTWGAPTQRATQQYSYQEVFDLLDDNLYNPAWGWWNGKKRSSRIRNTFDPSAIMNWIWKPKAGTTVNTAIGFRSNRYATTSFERTSNSSDPRPDYYRYLPSWVAPTAEAGTELYNQQKATYDYITNQWLTNSNVSQINWDAIYFANRMNSESFDRNPELRGQSSYIL